MRTDPAAPERRRKRYAENREQMLAASAEWKRTHPEDVRAYVRAYEAKYRHRISQQHKAYYQAHADKLRAAISRYRREHPTWALAYNRNRRARKRFATGTHTAEELQGQFKRQRGLCYYCGAALDRHRHADHVIPLSRGGSNDIGNVVWACQACNQQKYNKLPLEWPEGGRLL